MRKYQLVLLLSLFTAACQKSDQTSDSNVFEMEKLVKIGMTKEEVERILGEPTDITESRKSDNMVGWGYEEIISKDTPKIRCLFVQFKGNTVSTVTVIE